jgi:hypothetical protein
VTNAIRDAGGTVNECDFTDFMFAHKLDPKLFDRPYAAGRWHRRNRRSSPANSNEPDAWRDSLSVPAAQAAIAA